MISALLGAAGLTMLDAPRLRLYATATLLLLVVSLSCLQLVAARAGEERTVMPVLLPALTLAALALYVTSLRGFVTLLNAQRQADRLSDSMWLDVLLLLFDLGCQQLTSVSRSVGLAIFCLAVGVAIRSFVLYQLLTFTRRMAEQLHLREKLPAATVHLRARR